ncbi:MAG: tRNA (N6-isopentenyl adenosine(37)-C2)-methylthiotransferase MiaB [Bacteroidetes bacterium]|nr:tRNA (N6-isopentenyl adenosine(37)-C2)-methylthiotransferase MiaB [Bacteroidota bacterium]
MGQKVYIETYGCQMNFSDSEIVASVLLENGFENTNEISGADLILVNTCSIREHAEQRVINRMREIVSMKKKNKGLLVGVIGCMASRLQEELVRNHGVNLVAGPDSYRFLPELIAAATAGMPAINTNLSEDETYSGIQPVRYDTNEVSAFLSIMRGCTNFCSYCVVPYTRGVERSRPPETIFTELEELAGKEYKEVTFLGQNVNSYQFVSGEIVLDFPDLLKLSAEKFPDIRFRFATSHPKDLSNKLIDTIASYRNICKSIHLPFQSGSNAVLKRMNRGYSREQYIERATRIVEKISDCVLTTDVIAGFCGETEDDHKQTIDLMRICGFSYAFMFKYSERPGTFAAKKLDDDVPEEVKGRRLQEIIELQQELSLKSNQNDFGKTFDVLAEGLSRRSNQFMYGRNSQNKVIVFPAGEVKKGDYVMTKVTGYTSATLIGEIVD